MFLPLGILAALSSYGLYLSYQNITRLQQYEERSEKAAEWSNTAAERLHKTRATQASGTVTLLISLLTALYLLFNRSSARLTMISAVVNVLVLFSSRTHMARFWNDRDQTQIPFVEKFNEAIKGSRSVVGVLGLLSFAWLGAGVLCLLGFNGL